MATGSCESLYDAFQTVMIRAHRAGVRTGFGRQRGRTTPRGAYRRYVCWRSRYAAERHEHAQPTPASADDYTRM